MQQRHVSEAEVEAAIANDTEPWIQIIAGGGRIKHKRFFYNNITAITDVHAETVVTAWRGERGGW